MGFFTPRATEYSLRILARLRNIKKSRFGRLRLCYTHFKAPILLILNMSPMSKNQVQVFFFFSLFNKIVEKII